MSNVVMVQVNNEGLSHTCIHVSILPQTLCPRTHPGCHTTLSRVPCAIQQVTVEHITVLEEWKV